MNLINLTDQLPTNGSNGTRSLRAVKYAVIHHDGVDSRNDHKPLSRYISQAKHHIGKGWKRLSYHVRIDVKGNAYLVNDFKEILWHAGNYRVNRTGIGICLDGDFLKHPPTPPQIAKLWELLNWLTTKRPDMPFLVKKTIKTHREVRWRPTSCPSKGIQHIIKAYKSFL